MAFNIYVCCILLCLCTYYNTRKTSVSQIQNIYRPCEKWDVHKGICSFPSGSVHFNHKQQSLMAGQPYKVFLELIMPESPTNKDLGMFMVCADFHSTDGRLITNSCRSAMLRYQSVMLDILFKMVLSPFYMVRHFEEKQKIYIELFSSYLEPEDQKVSDIHIEIQTKHIEIYSAKFTISANFSGLRYIMFHFPILSAVIGITSNLFFIAFVSMISWYQIINSEEYLEYLRSHGENNPEDVHRTYILEKDTSSSEEDISVVGSEEGERLRRRGMSASEC
ncbi:seipin isoform X1 [Harmonia axyridis]|uniref:seipin isoform X1 n=1 Tax=Harmonia axyridis TaxID=115357 RepID=UPI001E2761B4|nr:seipin isoform X1 [Harmonia axyridis]